MAGSKSVTIHGYAYEMETDVERVVQDMQLSNGPKDGFAAVGAALGTKGRTYHGYNPGSYFLPNDTNEQSRLDWQHHICVLALDGKLGLAPVHKPKHVLDAATGTGIWAIEYAKQNPDSYVLGSDLSIIQRPAVLANCSFVQHDVERDDWSTYGDQFDYIHMAFIITCFDDTFAVLGRCFANLRSGGYIEILDTTFDLIDFDGSASGSNIERWASTVRDGASRVGRDLLKSMRYPAWCREIGFVDVREELIPMPTGPWLKNLRMKNIGRQWMYNIIAVIDSLHKFLLLAGLSDAEARELAMAAKKDCMNPRLHSGWTIRVTYARKPA